MSYSESRDFGGVQRDIDGERLRVGFLPRRRLLIGAGEWFMDGIKLATEYSRDWDYSKQEGGTERSTDGLFTSLTMLGSRRALPSLQLEPQRCKE